MTGERQPLIAVVDGRAESRASLHQILTAARFEVVGFDDATALDAWLVDRDPDGFILDADLDGTDGVRLCARLREQPRFRSTPILIATDREDRYLLRAAFTAGCDDFLMRPLEPIVAVARIGGLMKKADYFHQLEEIRAELARYVSPRIRHQVEWRVDARCAPPAPALMDVCILFSDIRGFTALSEQVDANELFNTVSDHLGAQVDCVYRHHGYVDKFGGDGLMAIFDDETMATDACRCALEIMERSRELSLPGDARPLPLGIGIHTGPVVVGNIGSGDHLDYTAIGEPVNVAARLCGQADSEHIIVSEDLTHRVGQRADLRFMAPERVGIRGVTRPLVLYHLRGPKTDRD